MHSKRDNKQNERSFKMSFFDKLYELIERNAAKIVSTATVSYILFFSALSVMRYYAFDYNDFDFAIFSQIVWNILHGSIESSILGIPFLGSHLNFILFLIAPVYAFFSHPVTLLIVQSVLFGLGVIPIYLLARDAIGKGLACVFSIVYLTYPALNFANMYEFHPGALAICFLLFMFYYFEKERFLLFSTFMFLSLLCKENISAAIVLFGLYALFFRRRSLRWWLLPLASGCVWFVMALNVLNYFNQGVLGYSAKMYGHLGRTLPEVFISIVRHPVYALKFMFKMQGSRFLLRLFYPLAFASLFAPKILCMSVPFFLQHLLSERSTDQSIYFHYAAKLIPFLFISAIYGLRFLLKKKLINHPQRIAAVLLFTCLVSNVSFGFLPNIPWEFRDNYLMQDIDCFKRDFVKRIPEDSSVVATFEFLPMLSSRKDLYSFHHVCKGTYTLSYKKYVLPENVEYALVDFNDELTFVSFYGAGAYTRLQDFFVNDNWGLLAAVDNIGLFKKGYKSNVRLFQMLKELPLLDSVRFVIADAVSLRKPQMKCSESKYGRIISLSLIWESLKEIDEEYWISFYVVDKDGNKLHQYDHPVGYRVHPSFSWNQGDIFKEEISMLVPSHITSEATLKMDVYWREHVVEKNIYLFRYAQIKSSIPALIDKNGWIDLGTVGRN